MGPSWVVGCIPVLATKRRRLAAFLGKRGAGNDRYQAPNLSLGAGNGNGIGIFWDVAGDDVYEIQGGHYYGRREYEGSSLRGVILCLGIFLDTGGNDVYPSAARGTGNNKCWEQQPPAGIPPAAPTKGVGLDEQLDR